MTSRFLVGAGCLVALVAVAPATATAPGLNGSIAFTSTRVGGVGNIFTMTAAGDDEVRRTVNAETDDDAAWSPDGTRFAFTRSLGGNQEIFVANADGSGVVRFTVDGSTDKEPTWSADGNRIAWASDRLGNFDIYSANLDGTGLIQHTSNGAFFDDEPSWSPDGSAIAFRSGRSGGNIHRVASSGTEVDPRQITTEPSDSPSWSPGGGRVAFSSSRGGNQDIYSLPSGGTPASSPPVEVDLRRHTSDPLADAEPAWSPDGTRIAFASFRNNADWNIWTTGSGGTEAGPLQLTNDAGADTEPAWQTVASLPFLATMSPASATAGSGPITLTVDGHSFAMRSRVRWQGQDRHTTFVSSNRLTAAIPASDLANPGQARVEVVTGPVGGGGSGQLVFTIAAPPVAAPPGLQLTRATLERRWKASRLRGRLRIAGITSRPATLRVRVLRPSGRGRALVVRTVKVAAAGPFSRRLRLKAKMLPGRYLVRASEVGGGPDPLPVAERRTALGAPREGVVSRAFFSTKINGRSLKRIRGRSIIFAHFVLAARPRPGKRLTVRWYRPGSRRPVAVDRKRASSPVIAFIKSRGALPRGRWRAELRYGRKLVATARVTVR